MDEKRLSLDLELKLLKSDDTGPGMMSGYAAVFGNKDRVGDVIIEGAFTNLDEFVRVGWASFDHFGTQFPVGTIKSARQDSVGLYVEIEFHSTEEAQNARKIISERMERGKKVGMSIFYRVIRDEYKEGKRILIELHVYEAGAVTLPANPQAQATDVKGGSAIDDTEPKRFDVKADYLRFVESGLEA